MASDIIVVVAGIRIVRAGHALRMKAVLARNVADNNGNTLYTDTLLVVCGTLRLVVNGHYSME